MAIEKTIVDDKIEVIGEYKAIQIRTATVVKEDGNELSRSFHRRALNPDADVSGESAEIQGIAAAVWTDDVKAAWQTYQENQPTPA
tara:strand:- start:74 stop:331 length:258 start_codon:yes stop_codon:yes gene_type:complete